MTLAIVASAFGAFHAIPATESTEMTVDPERSLLKKNAALTRDTFRRWPWASGMKSIFAEAVEQDFLLKDPTRGIKIPRNLRENADVASIAGGARQRNDQGSYATDA